MQGTVLGGVEGVAWLLTLAAAVTQAQQLMQNVRL